MKDTQLPSLIGAVTELLVSMATRPFCSVKDTSCFHQHHIVDPQSRRPPPRVWGEFLTPASP